MSILNGLKRASSWSLVAIAFQHNVLGIHRIPDDLGMTPTIAPTDSFILVNKLTVRLYNVYERGSIVLLHSPSEPGKYLLRRLVGIQGDWITSRSDHTAIEKIPQGRCWVETETETIPPPSSSPSSSSSHAILEDSPSSLGPVPLALMVGKAVLVAWPPSRWFDSSDLSDSHRFRGRVVARGGYDDGGGSGGWIRKIGGRGW